MSLFVAAHYKNQPNDLQLMSDAPGHHIFALCGPLSSADDIPDIFCVVHVCEEGKIAPENLASNLGKGIRPAGDLIPYTLAQYFMEQGFSKLAGIRVVRIATNPDFQRSGYGTRALQLLIEYYKGNIAVSPQEVPVESARQRETTDETGDEILKPRANIPVLLTPIDQRQYEPVDYIGASFGVTTELFNFWHHSGFVPLYIRQAPNDLTGEHSCVMVHSLGYDFRALRHEFQRRFLSLLPLSFRTFPTDLALSIVCDVPAHVPQKLAELTTKSDNGKALVDGIPQANYDDVLRVFTPSDLKRIGLFGSSYVDFNVVLDLIPAVAKLYFSNQIYLAPDGGEGVVLTLAQAAVLLAVGLQCMHFESLPQCAAFSGLQPQQLRAFFNKAMTRIAEHFRSLSKASAGEQAEPDQAGEQQQEVVDEQGNVVGISVAKRVAVEAPADPTLFRDAKQVGIHSAQGGDAARPQKKRRVR